MGLLMLFDLKSAKRLNSCLPDAFTVEQTREAWGAARSQRWGEAKVGFFASDKVFI